MNHLHYDLRYLLDCWREAISATRDHRLRTFLSVFGMAIGIASMVIVAVISESGRDHVFAEMNTYGLKTLWIYRDREEDNPLQVQRAGSGIDNDDYEALKQECCSAVASFSPWVYAADWEVILRVGSRFSKAVSEGADVDYFPINNEVLEAGRLFRPLDIERRQPVAIIGPATKNELFGEAANAIGKTIRMGELSLTVIGVLAEKRRDFLSAIGVGANYDINKRIIIPYTLYQQQLGNDDIHTLLAQAKDMQSIDTALEQIRAFLDRRHHGNFRYKTESMKGWIATTNEIVYSITAIGLGAAIIALLIGSVGIMSIMSSAVVERTREIGIRLAVGARQRDIHLQFLLESFYIALLGGVTGLLLGYSVVLGLGWWSGFSLQPSWLMAISGVLISMLAGVLAGYLPARRAARLSPAQALRHD